MTNTHFTVKDVRNNERLVAYDDIVCVKVSDTKLTIFLMDGTSHSQHKSLRKFLQETPEGLLLKIHKSAAIRLPFAKRFATQRNTQNQTLTIVVGEKLIELRYARTFRKLTSDILRSKTVSNDIQNDTTPKSTTT